MRSLPLLRRLALGLVLTLSLPAAAQSVPSWAEPHAAEQAPPADGPSLSQLAEGLASMAPCPPGTVSDGTGGCIPDPPPQVPIDGGLGLLALAGAGLAARRLRRRED